MKREHLLQEVIANPQDDEPRLIYADWLEEQGDPQAEFVRLQIQRSKLPVGSPLAPALVLREEALFREHGTRWAGPLAKFAGHCRFVRGFVEEISLGFKSLLANFDSILSAAPIRNIGIDRADDHLEQLHDSLVRHPRSRLHTIRFSNPRFGEEALTAFLRQDECQGVQTVGIKQIDFPQDTCHAVAIALPNLRSLFLQGSMDRPELDTGVLAPFQQLNLLALRDFTFAHGELIKLSETEFPCLKALSIQGLAFEEAGERFLNSMQMPNLRWIDFSSATNFPDPALLNGRTLERLALPHNALTDRQFASVISSPALAALRYLDLRYCRRLTQRSVTTLIESRTFQHLDCLRFSIRNHWSFAAIEQLATAWAQRPRPKGRLCLAFHGLSNGEVRRLTEQFGRMMFNELDLGVEIYDITQFSSNLVMPEEHLSEILGRWDGGIR